MEIAITKVLTGYRDDDEIERETINRVKRAQKIQRANQAFQKYGMQLNPKKRAQSVVFSNQIFSQNIFELLPSELAGIQTCVLKNYSCVNLYPLSVELEVENTEQDSDFLQSEEDYPRTSNSPLSRKSKFALKKRSTK